MTRSPESVLHETDYWRALLHDIGALNEQIAQTSGNLMDALPEIAFGTVEQALEHTGLAMKRLGEMQTPLHRIMDLAAGRVKALNAEVDGG